ncbi:hypothetical protein BD626DRAFT_509846 [Schizophyllum amplum]|uniref:Uncharacterized protein n=1 Tax=Schizophyllum amplum TaxID=97359 RepID=A0A550C268_9AGAR|nr:hypothetical protein BD626DRAFT_509846 [Auriculariopsis ampla]
MSRPPLQTRTDRTPFNSSHALQQLARIHTLRHPFHVRFFASRHPRLHPRSPAATPPPSPATTFLVTRVYASATDNIPLAIQTERALVVRTPRALAAESSTMPARRRTRCPPSKATISHPRRLLNNAPRPFNRCCVRPPPPRSITHHLLSVTLAVAPPFDRTSRPLHHHCCGRSSSPSPS